MSHARRNAYVSLAIGVFAIGWSAILVRWSGVSGMVSAFYRLAIATLVLVPWRLLAKPPSTRATRAARIAAITAGVLFAADLAFFNSAVMLTSAANASLLGVNAPIFVALGAWIMYGERPTTRFWLGFGLAFIGLIAIVGADVLLHPSLGFGDALAVVGAFCYGIYILYVGRSRAGMDTLTFSTWSAAVGAFCMLVVCLLARQPLTGFSGRSWAALIALALTSQVVGQLFIAHALGHLPPAPSSIGLLGQAPLTALLAWPLLGERIRLGQVIGGAMVLAGIIVVNVTRFSAGDAFQRLRQGRSTS
ncbi:MAG: DMT family transporter [bacterium]